MLMVLTTISLEGKVAFSYFVSTNITSTGNLKPLCEEMLRTHHHGIYSPQGYTLISN